MSWRVEHSCTAYRKGQAQPLAAALATATTVLCRLMLMLLTGAVAVACSVWCAPSMGALQMGFKSPVGRPNMMRTKEVMKKLLPEVNSERATDRGEED